MNNFIKVKNTYINNESVFEGGNIKRMYDSDEDSK